MTDECSTTTDGRSTATEKWPGSTEKRSNATENQSNLTDFGSNGAPSRSHFRCPTSCPVGHLGSECPFHCHFTLLMAHFSARSPPGGWAERGSNAEDARHLDCQRCIHVGPRVRGAAGTLRKRLEGASGSRFRLLQLAGAGVACISQLQPNHASSTTLFRFSLLSLNANNSDLML